MVTLRSSLSASLLSTLFGADIACNPRLICLARYGGVVLFDNCREQRSLLGLVARDLLAAEGPATTEIFFDHHTLRYEERGQGIPVVLTPGGRWGGYVMRTVPAETTARLPGTG